MKTKAIIISVVASVLLFGIVSWASYDPLEKFEANYASKIDSLRVIQIEVAKYEAILKDAQSTETIASNEICEMQKAGANLKLIAYFRNKVSNPEELDRLISVQKQDCTDWKVNLLKEEYSSPSDLFYSFLVGDGAYVTQSFQSHFSRNKYMAIDLGTSGRKLDLYAPSFMPEEGKDEERTYTVKLVHNYDTMGMTLELHWTENEIPYNWAIGHVNTFNVEDGDIVKTGDKIGLSGGCLGELKEGEKSTGCHAHIELRIDGVAVAYPTWANTVHNPKELCVKKDVGEEQQQYVRMAAEISNNDITFLALLNSENGLWTPDRTHNDGIGFGFCGISRPWHNAIIDDERFLTDPHWQLEQCWRLYKGGTKFYGNIDSQLDKFECK